MRHSYKTIIKATSIKPGLILIFLVFSLYGCGPAEGPDALTNRHASSPSSGCSTACHSAIGGISPNPLITNGLGADGKHIIHVSGRGIFCDKCHMNYDNEANHFDSSLDTRSLTIPLVRFDNANPSGAWTASAGTCSSLACHGTDTLDWYGTTPWIRPACSACHSTATATRRQVMGANGDFGVNTAIESHHIAGVADPTSGQCEACHDLSKHTSGAILVRNADTDTGIIYDPAVPATLEPFCLSCHDDNGATSTFSAGGSALNPFNDGAVLGGLPPNLYQAGNKIAGYWNSASNIHKSGGLTCAGSGQPLTGCHGSGGTINMHGSSSAGLLTKNMNFRIPLTFDSVTPANTFVYDNYRLCLDCHNSYPRVSKEVVLGYKSGGGYDVAWAPTPYYTTSIQTRFRERYIPPPATNYPAYWSGLSPSYNDNNFFGQSFIPLHNYHLLGNIPSWLSWKYRGNALLTGRITCTACHNVHGTSGTVASTYEEFGIVAFNGLGIDQYTMLSDPNNYEDDVFKAFPVNCSVSCHGIMGVTSYWHTPSGE